MALLLGLLATLRYATWQGPVVFTAPEVQFLLGFAAPRAELVRVRLGRGLLVGAAAGAALGLAAFVLLEAELAVAAWPLLAAALGGLAAFGVLAAALGWLVESSPVTARVVLLASPLVLAAAGPPGSAIRSRSGPTRGRGRGGGRPGRWSLRPGAATPAGPSRRPCWPP